MAGDLVTQSSLLPGLLPDQESRALLGWFLDRMQMGDRGEETLPRLPTQVERQVLSRRHDALGEALEPIGGAGPGYDAARQSLAALFGGYHSLKNTDVGELLTLHLAWLGDLPAFAVIETCRAIGRGEGRIEDPVSGKEESVGIRFPPNETQLYAMARKVKETKAAEFYAIKKVLRIRHVEPPPVPEAERVRIKAGLEALADSMRMPGTKPDLAKMAAVVKDNEPMIEALWRADGYEPMRGVDGRLRTPALLKTIGGWPPKGAKPIKAPAKRKSA